MIRIKNKKLIYKKIDFFEIILKIEILYINIIFLRICL
jgi:hypothetical protein